MMEPDFPAAHSMDSAWFAVDKDGHVAYFSTGEAGAMPEAGVVGDDAHELLNRIAHLAPRSDVVHDPRGHHLPDGRPSGFPLMPGQWPMLLFVTSLDPLRAEIDAGRATVVPAADGHAVVLQGLSAELVELLQTSGVVTAHAFHFERPDGAQSPAELGLFQYGHLCENWISGPYGRESIPTQPLHVDQLPPGLRNHLKQATLADRSFADTVYLQPAEHWNCGSWEPGWLGLDGVVRPFTGREEEFATHTAELRGHMPQYKFEES